MIYLSYIGYNYTIYYRNVQVNANKFDLINLLYSIPVTLQLSHLCYNKAIIKKGSAMEQKKLPQQAYDILKRDIINLNIRPGAVLYELELSRQLNISRTPIRSALQRLLSDELVELKRGRKNYFYAAGLSLRNFREIYQVRIVLESLAAELASLNHQADDIRAIEANIARHQELVADQASLKDLLAIDLEFHKAIARASDNRMLYQQVEKITHLYYRYNYYAINSNNRVKQAISEHVRLLEAISAADPDQAARLMREHLSRTSEGILFELTTMDGID